MPETRRRPLVLIAAGTIAALVALEIGVRIATRTPLLASGDSYSVRDPVIGRIPRPGVTIRALEGFTITIGEHGTRSNGGTPPRSNLPPILAVGDSFAFGDGVDDADSWPALLEQLTGRRVINGAVPGFGLDQAVLRAEQLAPLYDPAMIIVSFIPHDVPRCEMSYWSGHAKPYFELEGNGLRLHPAPSAAPSAGSRLKRLLSMSALLATAFPTFVNWEGPMVVAVHEQGPEVACRLMARLAAYGAAHQIQIVVLAQPQAAEPTPEDVALKDGVLRCAAANDLVTVDAFPVFDRIPVEQRRPLFPRHMSAEGNQLIARALAHVVDASALRDCNRLGLLEVIDQAGRARRRGRLRSGAPTSWGRSLGDEDSGACVDQVGDTIETLEVMWIRLGGELDLEGPAGAAEGDLISVAGAHEVRLTGNAARRERATPGVPAAPWSCKLQTDLKVRAQTSSPAPA